MGGEATGVRVLAATLDVIRREAARAYPHEGCGALLGPEAGDVRVTIPLPNSETGQPRRRFKVSPEDYLNVEDAAEARGLRLLGFWHSHPDHPARPSPTDRRYAWEGLLTLIVAVEAGEPAEVSVWEVPGRELPFRQLGFEEAMGAPRELPGTRRS
jgi:proteasome lid subunit RPN8/RPN11